MRFASRRLGLLTLLGALLVAFGVLRPGADTPVAEAELAAPGGISAMPSAAPAIPGVINQGIPAIIRARGPGNDALVTVFCDPEAAAPGGGQGLFPYSPCADLDDDDSYLITFEMTRVYPPTGSPASSFAVGGTELICADDAPCDYNNTMGVVVVGIKGGGVNEVIEVRATDEAGESRSVQIVVVDTILAWGPTGAVTTASQREPAYISYACDDIGKTLLPSEQDAHVTALSLSLSAYAELFADADGVVGLDDLWELMYDDGSGFDYGALDNIQADDIDIPLVWCGGDTTSSLDDFVDFQTDKGIFSVDPAAVETAQLQALAAYHGVALPAVLDFDCGEGKNIDVFDIDALAVWGSLLALGDFTEGGCDADFARNGVVTTAILGSGEVGVATITAQQGGGVSPPRTINLTFVGEAALSLFIDAPESIGVEGGDFSVLVVDEAGRPAGSETVQCTVEPTGSALVVVPQTGTTGSLNSDHPGAVSMTLVPTGASVLAGEELTLTCILDRDRSISASTTISLSTVPGVELVELVIGCSPIGSTWDDGTDIATVAGAVEPAGALVAIWAFDAATGTWLGYAPAAPTGVSDLTSVDRLQAIFICASDAATVGRPVL